MRKSEAEPLHLRRIDTACNMARFYSLTIQPTLFGSVSLIRNWGRIGTNGQVMIETFDESADAEIALTRIEGIKRRKGYAEVSPASCKTRESL